MPNTFDDNQTIISSFLFPENFLINNSIGIIEVNEKQLQQNDEWSSDQNLNSNDENCIEIFESNQFNRFFYDDQNESMIDSNNFLLSSMKDLNYSYFMNNNKNSVLLDHIKDGYNEVLSDHLSSNIGTNNNYSVYYENPINLNVSSNFIQVNDKIYLIDKNLFDIKNNIYLNNDHILNYKDKDSMMSFYNRDPKSVPKSYTVSHKTVAKLIDEELNISGVVISGLFNNNLKSNDVILTGYINNTSLKIPSSSILMSSLISFDNDMFTPHNGNMLNTFDDLFKTFSLESLSGNLSGTLSNVIEAIRYKFNSLYQTNKEKFEIINDLLNRNLNISESMIQGFLKIMNNDNKQALVIDNTLVSYISFDKVVSNINDKSVPIYDISNKSLSNIDLICPISQAELNRLINSSKYKPLLSGIFNKILYNSKINQISTENYDSILIKPIYNILKEKSLEFFKDLFSILPINSFFRFLNPIGKISNSLRMKNNRLIITDNSEITNYVFSIKDNEFQSIKFNDNSVENIDFNYFTLKNLQNPENYYDYVIANFNDEMTYDTNYFNINQNVIDEMINYYNDVKDQILNYSLNHIISKEAVDNFITEYNLSQTLIAAALENYDNINETHIINCINGIYTNFKAKLIRNTAILLMFTKEKYGFNLTKDEYKKLIYFIEIEKLYNFINEYYQKFKTKFKDFNGLVTYKEINKFFTSTLSLFPSNNESKNNIFRNSQIIKLLKFVKSSNIKYDNKQIGKGSLNQIMTNLEATGLYSFSNEKDNILSVYNDVFSKENFMKIDGFLYGNRNYKKLSKSNYLNKLWTSYSYFTSYDKNFNKDNKLTINISNQPTNVSITFNEILSNSYAEISRKIYMYSS